MLLTFSHGLINIGTFANIINILFPNIISERSIKTKVKYVAPKHVTTYTHI